MEGSAKIEKAHHILLIEDDPAFARLVKAYLSDVDLLSCTITHVANLSDGRTALRKPSPSFAAVLLDLSLPDSSGFKTLETLLYHFPKLNVIVMTGQMDKRLGVEAVKAGAQDFLVKGEFTEEGLAKSLRFSIERNSIINRLEETQRMARIGHWECSPSEHYFSGSEELYRIFGRPFQNKLGCEDMQAEAGPYHVFKTLQERAQVEERVQIDTWIQPESGLAPRFVSLMCSAYQLANGEPFFNGIVQDITERKQTQELKKERDLAEQAANVREQFIASISHEMRTPMNAILGMSNLLHDTPLNQEQREYVTAIKRSSDLLLGIISDILEMSTLQNDKVQIQRKPFSIRELLEGLVSVLKYKAREKQLGFQLYIDERIPAELEGDALRLNQILYNLVGNAIKFTEEGAVRLAVSCRGRTARDCRLLFEVEDTGLGIPADQIEKIFETFVRLPTADKIYEGTGLGLSIAKKLVEQQGGALRVESTPGSGSRFFFELSFGYQGISVGQASCEKASPVVISDDLSFRLLIVEDHKMNQLVASRTIQKKWPSVSILLAGNGEEAIQILETEPVDLILMDIQMPIMDGFTTVNLIRNRMPKHIARLPVLAITAHANIAQQERFKQSGFNDFVFKPFEPQQLFIAIERQLQRAEKQF